MEYHAKTLSELLVRLQVILRAIPGEPLIEVFVEPMKQCINMNGEFVG
jgi:hypothetical protein